MNTESYIQTDFLPFDTGTGIKEAKLNAEQWAFSHIPVVKKGQFLGCISETDLQSFEDDKTIADYGYAVEPVSVHTDSSWLEILEHFARHSANMMPVVNDHRRYVGYYELGDIMGLFKQTPFLNEPGNIFIVEKASDEWSFSEVCQIVESNNARLIGVFVSEVDGDKTQLTIKTGEDNLNTIVQTFRRYGYQVVSTHKEDRLTEVLQEHADYLNRYLEV